MIYCISQLRVIFREYNKAYFGNILPMPYFKIRHSVNILGLFHYDPRAVPGTTETIEISDFYDYTESQLRNLMVHEMLHYYLAYTGIEVYPDHGDSFINMAKQLNRTYGLNITPNVVLKRMTPRANAPFFKRLYYKLIS